MNMFKAILGWFVDPNFGLGDPIDIGQQPLRYSDKRYPHVHNWEYFNTIRCGWRVEDGHPVGQRIGLTIAILDVEKNPNKTETKLSQLRDWQRSGYQFVHTSSTVYKCKTCGETKNVDHFAAPVKSDGSGPLVVDVGSRCAFQKRFTETAKINTVNNLIVKREIAVEPMKRYGSKPKPVRPAPVVPMED